MKSTTCSMIRKACLALCSVIPVQAALNYRVISRTGDVATGSSVEDPRPVGTFTYAQNIFECRILYCPEPGAAHGAQGLRGCPFTCSRTAPLPPAAAASTAPAAIRP